ncbi:MAG: aminotransferase class V-fold PLP-dependent enzyme [Candidatus Gastranaerophilales bacterium]|nr:aminotransferase class V-fold PLP-dependent enzyme [Candidatus Gastranaerophilales bacterium]
MKNINEIRQDFPVVKNLIYFDHAAVAPLHNQSKIILNEYLNYFLNFGIKDYSIWAEKIETIRSKFAEFIGADSCELAFIKNTSAGLSVLANGIKYNNGDNVIIPDIEFPSNVYPWMNLDRFGVKTKFLKTKEGIVDLNEMESLIDNKTRVVSVSWVEFSNGFRNDMAAISKLCKKKSQEYGRKIYFCVDAIQGLGALKLDLKETEIDFLAADGHKWFLALEGAGILYCNKKILKDVHPTFVGWKSVKNPLNFTDIHFDLQESAAKFEEGSMNVAGILSLGASLDLFNDYGIDNIEKRVLGLTKYAADLLQSKNIEIISVLEEKHRSGILTFKTKDIDKDYLKLLANRVQLSKRGDALRISPHFYNTEEEIEKFAGLIF